MSVSQVNGLFQELQQQKRERTNLSTSISKRNASLITYLRNIGPVMVYKEDTPTMLQAVKKSTIKLDKALLVQGLGISASSLNVVKIAELVDEGKLTVEKIENCQYEDEDYRLKQRKAKKKDILAFQNQK